MLIFVLKDHRGAPSDWHCVISLPLYRCGVRIVCSERLRSLIRSVPFYTCAVFRQLALTSGAIKEGLVIHDTRMCGWGSKGCCRFAAPAQSFDPDHALTYQASSRQPGMKGRSVVPPLSSSLSRCSTRSAHAVDESKVFATSKPVFSKITCRCKAQNCLIGCPSAL